MQRPIKEYFTFTKRERNGILVLTGILVTLLMVLSLLPEGENKLDIEITELQTRYTDSVGDKYRSESGERDLVKKEVKLFGFDPNTLDLRGWKKLGFSDKQAQVILNYRSKGGVFYKKDDLKKMYCVSEERYQRLEPFITIKKQSDSIVFKTLDIKYNKVIHIELNSASVEELKQISGIGPKLSDRIVKFRGKLGGFVTEDQLFEVYGLDSGSIDLSNVVFSIDTLNINRIDINKASKEALKSHPYINYKMANLIVNYRQQHGSYKNLNELLNLDLVNKEIYIKIVPYLRID